MLIKPPHESQNNVANVCVATNVPPAGILFGTNHDVTDIEERDDSWTNVVLRDVSLGMIGETRKNCSRPCGAIRLLHASQASKSKGKLIRARGQLNNGA